MCRAGNLPHSALPSLALRQLVQRRCPACDWQVERIEDPSTDIACAQCHGATVTDDAMPLPTGVDLSGVARAKDLYAAALGRFGGLKGGKARAGVVVVTPPGDREEGREGALEERR